MLRQVYQAHDAQGIYTNTALQRMRNDAQAHQFGNQPREYTGDHYYERLKSMHRQRIGAEAQSEAERKAQKRGKAPSGYSPTLWKNFQMQRDLIEKKYENQEAIIGAMKSHAVRSIPTRRFPLVELFAPSIQIHWEPTVTDNDGHACECSGGWLPGGELSDERQERQERPHAAGGGGEAD
jgi:hypothetical protein